MDSVSVIMPRNSHFQNSRKALLIERLGSPLLVPCTRCFQANTVCIMSLDHSAKCARCLKQNKPCSHRERSDKEFDRLIDSIDKKKAELTTVRQLIRESKSKKFRLKKELDFLKEKSLEFLAADSLSNNEAIPATGSSTEGMNCACAFFVLSAHHSPGQYPQKPSWRNITSTSVPSDR
jgi:hypothetical protein